MEYVDYGGWKNNVLLANDHAEVIVTLDVGPRVISYRTPRSRNVFKNYAPQIGGANEAIWQIRGGHRFWLAPEDPVLTYIPDNSKVEHTIVSPNEARFVTGGSELVPIEKTLSLALDPNTSRVTVNHHAKNQGVKPITLATWALSVMAPGGTEIIPLPPLGSHPRDLLPTRRMIVWPFTDMSDSRWRWGQKFITLKSGDGPPAKLGLNHTEGWVAYHLDDQLFVKTIPFRGEDVYADLGCNFETFTNDEMLEVESLGPLVTLEPGESTSHAEHWFLFDGVGSLPNGASEEALADWVEPFASRVRNYAPRRT